MKTHIGLLGSIIGGVVNGAGALVSSAGEKGGNPLIQMAMQILTARGQGGQSGLADVLSKFQQGGLGHLADSWVGTGANMPVTAEQISQVLGSGKLGELANQFGLSTEDIAAGLSKLLPDLINHITPDGQLPNSSDFISNALSMFIKR